MYSSYKRARPSMTRCSAAPSSVARASTAASSWSVMPPVSTIAVMTSAPSSRSFTRQYEVSRPPEKARMIVCALGIVGAPVGDEHGHETLGTAPDHARRQDGQSRGARIEQRLQLHV